MNGNSAPRPEHDVAELAAIATPDMQAEPHASASDGDAFLSMYRFNDRFSTWFEARPAEACASVAREDYRPGGSTALFDAIGETIERTECCRDNPNVVMMIMTDGHENASRRFSAPQVRGMIERVRGRGWNVLFLGCEADCLEQASRIGMHSDYAVRFSPARGGSEQAVDMIAEKTARFSKLRQAGLLCFSPAERDALKRVRGEPTPKT